MYKPTALITGITGQDGSWLSKQLIRKGYEVHGLVRQQPRNVTPYIAHMGDITCFDSIENAIHESRPAEIYNLAAMSHVGMSYKFPELTMQTTGIGAANVFQAAWEWMQKGHPVKVYQAGSSEMMGQVEPGALLNESSPMNPISPYAVAKVMAHHSALMYRQMGLPVWCGILFNHESENRPFSFVTTKIASAAAHRDHVKLGNLDAVRDWGYAPEYTEGMWRMMQESRPDTYVLATGVGHTVKEFTQHAYAILGLNWEDFVEVDENQKRPLEAGPLVGDYSKAYLCFGWQPQTMFEDLVRRLVIHFLEV